MTLPWASRPCIVAAAAALLHLAALSWATWARADGLPLEQPALGSGFALFPAGSLTSSPSDVIAGKASIKGLYSGANAFTPYLQTIPSVVSLAPNHAYRVTFQYKILAAAPNGFQAFFNSPIALSQGTPSNPGGTFFHGDAGATGTATFMATLGAFADYQVLWGINGTGAILVDNIEVEDGASGEVLATEDAERILAFTPIVVKVPSNTPPGDTISLFAGALFPDPKSPIAMNRVPGTTDTWQATLSRPAGTIVAYFFLRNGDFGKREAYVPVGAANTQVYRKLLITNLATVNETVAQWVDLPPPPDISTGTLTGTITDQAGNPLTGIWVSAGPHQTRTDTDGDFTIYGVPAGPCTVTVQSENGEYVAASEATTIAPNGVVIRNMTLQDAAMSTVTFRVTVPRSTPVGAVPRLYGDTYRLGMVQIPGGPPPDTTRMIDMAPVGGDQWSHSVQLGSGTCVDYLYTLGSYQLSYERDARGNIVTRSLCVNGSTTVDDAVAAWKAPQQVPVTLTVASPTGARDALFVTANESLGFAPVKMWPTGPGTATYTFYADPSSTLSYRYVRNADPDTGIESLAPGTSFRPLAVGTDGAASNDTIAAWQNQMREPALDTVTTGITEPIPRSAPFQTGIQLIDYWRSSWRPLVEPTLARVHAINARWVQIVPNWSFLSPVPEDFGTPLAATTDPPKVDPRYNEFPVQDLVAHIRAAKAAGLQIALNAQPYPNRFSGAHSPAWYDKFFEQVRSTLLSIARIARQEGVEMLILGDFFLDTDIDNDSATRSLVNGKWKEIVAAIRDSGFTGKLASQGGGNTGKPLRPEYDWYADLDYIGIFWQIPVAATEGESVQSMYQRALQRLATQYQPIFSRFKKPLIFTSVMFYSARSSALQSHDLFEVISPEFAADPSVPSDYDEQGRAYQALFRAFAATPWVQGAYPFAYEYFDLDNKAYSIRGKTAESIVSRIYRQINLAVESYQGLWWNRPAGSESGWGINFAHQGDTLFATWFTYGADGRPLWFIAVLARTAGTTEFTGPVSTVTGPPFDAVPFDAKRVVETIVGSMTVTFADSNDGTLSYTVNGITQTKPITRQIFGGPVPTCAWGTQPDLALATNFQDLWWAAPPGSESGWGINLTQQGDVIFATWFIYDDEGMPTWLIVVAQRTSGNVFDGPVSTVIGPPFSATPFDPAQVVETVVGSATFTFADGNNATFAYTVDGHSASKGITRQVFAPPGTVCQ